MSECRYLQETARILHTYYDDDIPPTLEGLVELPGVGPKMAFLCLQVAWKQCVTQSGPVCALLFCLCVCMCGWVGATHTHTHSWLASHAYT
jgi:hypothetical protein